MLPPVSNAVSMNIKSMEVALAQLLIWLMLKLFRDRAQTDVASVPRYVASSKKSKRFLLEGHLILIDRRRPEALSDYSLRGSVCCVWPVFGLDCFEREASSTSSQIYILEIDSIVREDGWTSFFLHAIAGNSSNCHITSILFSSDS
jgi:hypothetical protein